MSTTKKNVVFDVVGTFVSYDNFFKVIDYRLEGKLRAEGITPKLLGFAWMEVAERVHIPQHVWWIRAVLECLPTTILPHVMNGKNRRTSKICDG
jgi:hypothetical protein